MKLEDVYRCDACGKEERWPGEVAKTWIIFETRGINVCSREWKTMHACSTACERRLYLTLAGEKPDPKQLEAEVRKLYPDLAKRLEDQERNHTRELTDFQAKILRLETEIMGLKLDGAQNDLVTKAELRDLLIAVLERNGGQKPPPSERALFLVRQLGAAHGMPESEDYNGDTTASIEGPFDSEEERLEGARRFWQDHFERGDNVFRLDIENGVPTISSFEDGILDGHDE